MTEDRMACLLEEIRRIIVGQTHMLESLLIGLLARGHILLEGLPGLAKTLAVNTLAKATGTDFKRIQFTPDLLPADLLGTRVFNQKSGDFHTVKGPIFAHLILADEVNRAPAKVQSALLECMQERQVTIGGETFPLPNPFLVLATQNPIESEGTYNLPEAQVDRFMLKVKVPYPDKEEELAIVNRMTTGEEIPVSPVLSPEEISGLQKRVDQVYVDEKIKRYVLDIVFSTRNPKEYDFPFEKFIQYGASPRASIYLVLTAKARAFLDGRNFVLPEDIKAVALDVLRHRIILTYEAEAEEMQTEFLLGRILEKLKVP